MIAKSVMRDANNNNIEGGNMSIEHRKSISLERDQNGNVSALIIGGDRIEKNRGRFEIPKEIASNIELGDLDFTIIVDFVDEDDQGVVFRAIQNVKGGKWEAVVMVRYNADRWDKLKNMITYAEEVATNVWLAAQSDSSLIFFESHIRPDHFLVAFTVTTTGVTVGEFLENARKKTDALLPMLI